MWLDQIEPLAAGTPLMPAPGNHETDPSEATNGGARLYRALFALPGEELYYGFDYGRVHFLVMHSTVRAAADDGGQAAKGLAFAEEDLRAAWLRKQAGELDFIIALQHHPLYANQDVSPPVSYLERQYNTPLIAAEEQLFHRYDVDLRIAGHNHMYERTKPMAYGRETDANRNAYADPLGFIEVITGGGGNSLYHFRDPNDVPSWSVVRARRYHYTHFEVDGKTLRAKAISTDHPVGEVLDTWTLTVR